MKGTIENLQTLKQRGTIRGQDDSVRHFRRENMVYWLQYSQLKRGVTVLFDVDSDGTAINVERDELEQ